MAMNKEAVISVLLVLGIVLNACAASTDKLLIREDLETVKQITVVRHEFPGFLKETSFAQVTAIGVMTPFILFGAIGGGIGGALAGGIHSAMLKSAGSKMQSRYHLPDFAELVHKEFSAKLPKSVSSLPAVIIDSTAI